MAHLPFMKGRSGRTPGLNQEKTFVDLSPWQTAQALVPLAVTTEETSYAREVLRLADHSVAQAFTAALRTANVQAQHRKLSGEALALSNKIEQLQQLVKEDQLQVSRLTPKTVSADGKKTDDQPGDNDELEIAKAQLGLDTDQLENVQEDLARATGDNRSQIQEELAAHETAVRKYENESHRNGQLALVSARSYGTLAGRLRAWMNQRERYALIQQAIQQTKDDISRLTAEHQVLATKTNTDGSQNSTLQEDDAIAKLALIKAKRDQRQLLTIYDDRIETAKQLVSIYEKWGAQVQLQHRILLHLILRSLILVLSILILMVVVDAFVRHATNRPSLDRRRAQTLRTILRFGVQFLGIVFVLLVTLGPPPQFSTILGLATAGVTIALQDYILAFLGWFVLMGRNGMRVGDWVEINGVSGEATEIGLFSTTLLETGTVMDTGHPTGRRITFLNSFAIRGQYFNFSTTGQWMWDKVTIPLPASENSQETVERLQEAVLAETKLASIKAEEEWSKARYEDDILGRFHATPEVSLQPSGSGIDIQVRYVTRAPERLEMRNRIYRRVIDLLHHRNTSQLPAVSS